DHDGEADGQGGIHRWLLLASAAGLDPEAVRSLRYVLPAVRFAVDAYVDLVATRSLTEAVASSLAELFSPTLMAERLAALESLYPWLERAGLQYFRTRLSEAPRDADFALQYVVAHCTTRAQQNQAVAALQRKCEILWSLLDAVYFAYVSPGLLPPFWSDRP